MDRRGERIRAAITPDDALRMLRECRVFWTVHLAAGDLRGRMLRRLSSLVTSYESQRQPYLNRGERFTTRRRREIIDHIVDNHPSISPESLGAMLFGENYANLNRRQRAAAEYLAEELEESFLRVIRQL